MKRAREDIIDGIDGSVATPSSSSRWATDDEIVDVEASYHYCLKYLNLARFNGVFINQIYSILSNRTFVDSCVCELIESMRFKLFSCQEYGLNDQVIIDTLSYQGDVQHYVSALSPEYHAVGERFSHLIANTVNVSFRREELKSFSQADIDRLVQVGFLKLRRSTHESPISYWISHPQLGLAARSIVLAREAIASFLRRRKYKEIEENILCHLEESFINVNPKRVTKKGELDKSHGRQFLASVRVLGIQYHLLDWLGVGIVVKTRTPSQLCIVRLNT